MRNQKGFGAVEGLLFLILLSTLGFVGYYVYHARNNANSTYNTAVNTSSLPSGTSSALQTYQGDGFTLKYPANWKFTPGNQQARDDNFSPLSNKSTSPTPIIYTETSSTSYTKAADDWPVNGTGRVATVLESKTLTINGYSAFYVVTTFNNSKTDTYDIVNNGKAVDINLTNNTDSAAQAVLQQFANSIKFQ